MLKEHVHLGVNHRSMERSLHLEKYSACLVEAF